MSQIRLGERVLYRLGRTWHEGPVVNVCEDKLTVRTVNGCTVNRNAKSVRRVQAEPNENPASP